MILQSDGQVSSMSIREAQRWGYSLTTTAQRVVLRSRYKQPHAELTMVGNHVGRQEQIQSTDFIAVVKQNVFNEKSTFTVQGAKQATFSGVSMVVCSLKLQHVQKMLFWLPCLSFSSWVFLLWLNPNVHLDLQTEPSWTSDMHTVII